MGHTFSVSATCLAAEGRRQPRTQCTCGGLPVFHGELIYENRQWARRGPCLLTPGRDSGDPIQPLRPPAHPREGRRGRGSLLGPEGLLGEHEDMQKELWGLEGRRTPSPPLHFHTSEGRGLAGILHLASPHGECCDGRLGVSSQIVTPP